MSKKEWTNKRKMIYAMQYTTLLAMILYIAWLIVDCVFIHKGLWFADWFDITWDPALYNATKIMSIVFIAAGGLVVACNLGYLIHRVFTLKQALEKNIYGIVINALIVILGLTAIISVADYIKYDAIVCSWTTIFGYEVFNSLTHIEFLNYTSALFIICCFSMLITWEKRENFGIELIEQDSKSTIRIFGLASILFYPFMVWLLKPVSILDSTNNLIAHVIATPMAMCFAMVFIGLFVEFVLQIYRKSKLGKKDNMSQIVIYGVLFVLIFGLFVASQSVALDLEKIEEGWKATIGIFTPELFLSLASVVMTIVGKKIKPKEKVESIYTIN